MLYLGCDMESFIWSPLICTLVCNNPMLLWLLYVMFRIPTNHTAFKNSGILNFLGNSRDTNIHQYGNR